MFTLKGFQNHLFLQALTKPNATVNRFTASRCQGVLELLGIVVGVVDMAGTAHLKLALFPGSFEFSRILHLTH